ncbi:essential MCU regulator, mitochondrial [Silurus meridionalis]|uniref:Essential MCU regulator, mitochondrial n=1 Tax=Silurus asotus TaxID=30991 RepID=A0AAD5FRW0_SILAS|nr:essential MCU regulator, mitochondrial [Silurus meridionalis]KAI5625904.1 essential MCU regulator, mitochondrial [Silurus asotus]
MASAARVLLRGFLTGNARFNSRNVNGVAPSRNAVTSTSGAILPKPDKIPFGVVRMAVVVAPFLYVGTLISKQFAALLEEHDIFVPDDDDD